MHISFNTRDYQLVNCGREPRGNGYWWFSANGKEYQAYGKYGDAKKSVKAQVVADNPGAGFITINVLG